MTTISLTSKNNELWENYQLEKANNRMLFPTEGANLLGVSELELVLASPFSEYIGSNCKDVLMQLQGFGNVESIVRNKLAVHEKIGLYHNLKLGEKMGLAINVGGLDLRFFMNQWAHVLAVKDESKSDKDTSASYSFQFFDKHGNAINKVFLRDISEQSLQKWQEIVSAQKATVDLDELTLEPVNENGKALWQYKALDDDKVVELQTKWNQLTDIHQFYFLLQKLDIDRASSYRQAPQGMTTQLGKGALESMLLAVKEQDCPLMTFVGNTGVVQIQTGKVHNVKRMGEWINILDKKETDFTLHLNDSKLDQIWCIRRPTKDGIVTCVEGFDEYGTSIITFFGERAEGEPEREDWQKIVSELERDNGVSVE